jgi:hypothetical protein
MEGENQDHSPLTYQVVFSAKSHFGTAIDLVSTRRNQKAAVFPSFGMETPASRDARSLIESIGRELTLGAAISARFGLLVNNCLDMWVVNW